MSVTEAGSSPIDKLLHKQEIRDRFRDILIDKTDDIDLDNPQHREELIDHLVGVLET